MDDIVPVLAPMETVNDEWVTLQKVFVPDGRAVSAGEALGELETSKAAVDFTAPSNGYIRWVVEVGQEVAVGTPIGYICSYANQTPPSPSVSSRTRGQERVAEPASGATILSPPRISARAQKIMDEHGLTTNDFEGLSTVREEDVRRVLEGRKR